MDQTDNLHRSVSPGFLVANQSCFCSVLFLRIVVHTCHAGIIAVRGVPCDILSLVQIQRCCKRLGFTNRHRYLGCSSGVFCDRHGIAVRVALGGPIQFCVFHLIQLLADHLLTHDHFNLVAFPVSLFDNNVLRYIHHNILIQDYAAVTGLGIHRLRMDRSAVQLITNRWMNGLNYGNDICDCAHLCLGGAGILAPEDYVCISGRLSVFHLIDFPVAVTTRGRCISRTHSTLTVFIAIAYAVIQVICAFVVTQIIPRSVVGDRPAGACYIIQHHRSLCIAHLCMVTCDRQVLIIRHDIIVVFRTGGLDIPMLRGICRHSRCDEQARFISVVAANHNRMVGQQVRLFVSHFLCINDQVESVIQILRRGDLRQLLGDINAGFQGGQRSRIFVRPRYILFCVRHSLNTVRLNGSRFQRNVSGLSNGDVILGVTHNCSRFARSYTGKGDLRLRDTFVHSNLYRHTSRIPSTVVD